MEHCFYSSNRWHFLSLGEMKSGRLLASSRAATASPSISSQMPRPVINTSKFHAPFGERYGPGGRQSVSGITATVFGSYGFLGRYVCHELGHLIDIVSLFGIILCSGSRGTTCFAPFRGCEMEVRTLKPMFDLGQVTSFLYFSLDASHRLLLIL
jgi:hypothetical protein